MIQQNTVHSLYKKLLKFYPKTFREQLAESMAQTFNDLYNEHKGQTKRNLLGFVFWTFIETAIGIFREYLLLISRGDIMQSILKTAGWSTLISLLINIPFIIMEIVNRRTYNEDFPFFLFFIMWLNMFAVILMVLPIVQGWRAKNHEIESSVSTKGNTLLTNPKRAALISILLIVLPGIFPLMEYFGWVSLDRIFNGPNPEVTYLPGLFLSLGFMMFPIASGFIAAGPIAHTLSTGGKFFAHPINLIIVVFLTSTFAIGVSSLIIDQWPCFIGVQHCD